VPLDPAAPLPALSDDQPAGPNLEFDPAFGEFERLAAGKPEQQYGSTIVPAEEPDWKALVADGWALLERTYDLRVIAQLAVGRLHREGLTGYAETLALIRHMLEQRWTDVHPQLDPDDDNDPTLRANALLAIAEPVRVVRFLRDLPLARSSRAGTVSWRDISISTGALEAEEGAAKVTEAVVTAAFRETDAATLSGLKAALALAIGSADAIPAAFDATAGYGTGPELGELLKLLRGMQRMVENYESVTADDDSSEIVADTDDAGAETGTDMVPQPAARARSAPVSIATLGPLTNRADAMRLLDLVIQYYEDNEPSSPLPLLIARARRLADRNFMDLMRDLAPDGLNQIERIAGTTSE
jgi:type VI secretion system protein ImpA